jgi:hypothetical protein
MIVSSITSIFRRNAPSDGSCAGYPSEEFLRKQETGCNTRRGTALEEEGRL